MAKSGTEYGSREPRRLYGRRHGKPLSAARQALVDEMLPEMLIALPEEAASLDPSTPFAHAPDQVWLEIGFGGGEHLVH